MPVQMPTDRSRLPGVYFEKEPSRPRDTLPRMDIAAFVGFAATGPVDTPVPIEDVQRFRDVFGPDLPLAWNPARGRADISHLGSAVEAFFSNGGRRCWVVRVARDPHRSVFAPRGLVDASTGRPVPAPARSPGSWADHLRVGTVLDEQTFHLEPDGLQSSGDTPGAFVLSLGPTPDPIVPGDLLRCTVGDSRVIFMTVERVDRGDGDSGASPSSSGRRVTARPRRWARLRPDTPGPLSGTAVRRGLTPDGDTLLGPCEVRPAEAPGRSLELRLQEDASAPLTAGDVIHVAAGDAALWLQVSDVHGSSPDGASGSGDPGLRLTARGGLWPYSPDADEVAALPDEAPASVVVERLRFSFLVWDERRLVARMGRLSFVGNPDTGDRTPEGSGPSRFWGLLPTDESLFALRDGRPGAPEAGTLAEEALDPRFPLAGSRFHGSVGATDPAAAGAEEIHIPLAMATRPHQEDALGPLPSTPSSLLERDGVASPDPALFLDRELARHTTRDLDGRVFRRRHVEEVALEGLHSLYPVREVSLVAIPDAVQRGWTLESSPVPPGLDAPTDLRDEPLEDEGSIRLRWTHELDGVDFELEEAREPSFSRATIRHRGSGRSVRLHFDEECPTERFYRVRARRGSLVSPWSSVRRVVVRETSFDECGGRLAAPRWDVAAAPDDGLAWTEVPGATAYVLEEAADPGFLTARIAERVHPPEAREHRGATPDEGVRFYRVRAERDGEVGPWSTTRRVAAPPRPTWVVIPDAAPSGAGPIERARLAELHGSRERELLSVQRALLRFCAARGDATALLALPERYREGEAQAHVGALTAVAAPRPGRGVPPLRADEAHLPGYGALYHPWLAMPEPDGPGTVRYVPPVGALAGVVAAHALAGQAWRAPANVVLRGPLGLRDTLDRETWRRLQAAQLNLVRHGAGGVRPLGADTLDRTPALRPLGTRRLLILLRRMLVRDGERFVFENNSRALRERIHFRLTSVLTRLFRRGAFAGETPEQAFVVDAGVSLNPPEQVDRGRLLAEVRVAPSRPLSFITVRLVQEGRRLLTVEEA